jgi:hypothetical protein
MPRRCSRLGEAKAEIHRAIASTETTLPDLLSRPPSFEDSILMVEHRMRRRIGGFERLDRQALRRYAARAPAAGWRLTVPTPDGERHLDVVVPRRFPSTLSRPK